MTIVGVFRSPEPPPSTSSNGLNGLNASATTSLHHPTSNHGSNVTSMFINENAVDEPLTVITLLARTRFSKGNLNLLLLLYRLFILISPHSSPPFRSSLCSFDVHSSRSSSSSVSQSRLQHIWQWGIDKREVCQHAQAVHKRLGQQRSERGIHPRRAAGVRAGIQGRPK